MSGRTTRRHLGEAARRGETDWKRLRGLTDEEIEAAVAEDSDSFLLEDADVPAIRGVIFRDSAGEWRWRLIAPDGRAIADAPRGYTDRDEVDRAILELRDLILAGHAKAA